jgi:hypothetical protein
MPTAEHTFLINVSGAFAMGYLSVLFNVDWRLRHGTAINAGVLTGETLTELSKLPECVEPDWLKKLEEET